MFLTIFHESRGEPIEGQYAVAEVVLNRAEKRNLEVCEVIYQKGNFKMHINGKVPSYDNSSWQRSLIVANDILKIKQTIQMVLHF